MTVSGPSSDIRAVQICSHEYGHALGLHDLHPTPGCILDWWGIGSFSNMGSGFPQGKAVPLDPWSRNKLGWVTPIEVTAPLYQQSIPDYLTTGTVYKMTIDSNQYFLVTNHKGAGPPPPPDTSCNEPPCPSGIDPGYWERKLPAGPAGGGLMIWHIDTTFEPQTYPKKLIDPELAHGLYNFVNYEPDTLHPNDSTGKDSLDIRGTKPNGSPFGYSYSSTISGSCWWNQGTKINFDGKSNPSSDGYSIGAGGVPVQNVPTHIAVRNIYKNPLVSGPATADLLVNNWYGHIVQNTTWSGFVAITGDIVVDSGVTLTILPGTIIYFQYNEDNQRSLPDTTRCAIIVKAGGRLIIGGMGSAAQFISSRSESQAGTEDWRGIVVKPGGYVSIENAIIRHAYAAIEDSSNYSHTIKNVRIGRCKAYGILAANTDSLTIRDCRIDSVNGSPGGYGIYVSSATVKGARAVKDTIKACGYGIFVSVSTTPVDSCVIEAATGGLTSLAGFYNQSQASLGGTDSLMVSYTSIRGYFTSGQIFYNYSQGRVAMVACTLISSTPTRTANGIRNTGAAEYLRLRRSMVTLWGQNGVLLAHNSAQVNLGTSADSGNNAIYTDASGSTWKYVLDQDCSGGCTSPTIYAERNCWGVQIPSSSRFSTNVDYTPYSNFCIVDPGPKIAVDREDGLLPKQTELYQNYPNPFNPTTQIQFNLEKREKVHLEIINILGQKVRSLLNGEEFSEGPYHFVWDGKDDGGVPVSSGTYFYQLRTPTFEKSKKMLLLK